MHIELTTMSYSVQGLIGCGRPGAHNGGRLPGTKSKYLLKNFVVGGGGAKKLLVFKAVN